MVAIVLYFKSKGISTMTNAVSSAQAYGKLKDLTDGYVQVKELYETWAQLGQRTKGLLLLLEGLQSNDTETISQLANFKSLCRVKSDRLGKWLVNRQNEMDTLNSLIQNGAYNGE
jgi:hypothetical protein